MAAKKTKGSNKPGYDFLVSALEKKPDAVYGDLKAKAEQKGMVVFPIMYGRAKAALGLVPSGRGPAKKKTTERTTTRKTAAATSAPKRRGRPPKARSAARNGADPRLNDLIGLIQSASTDRERMRSALEKIRDVIQSAL